MAPALCEDVIRIVFEFTFKVSDSELRTASSTFWGQNDHVPASGLLVVCRDWHALGTPLLYETVILRSTGQTCALARTLEARPDLRHYVRNVRLEGAYFRLDEVFRNCPNLVAVCLLLREIIPADSVSSLITTFGVINPEIFVLVDFLRASRLMNPKKKQVFDALCEAIPSWTNLNRFHYPYTEHNLQHDDISFSCRCLKKALELSPSLREIYCFTPCIWDSAWKQLASNDHIKFYLQSIDDHDTIDSIFTKRFLEQCAHSGIPNLRNRVHVVALEIDSTTSPIFQPFPLGLADTLLSLEMSQDYGSAQYYMNSFRPFESFERRESKPCVVENRGNASRVHSITDLIVSTPSGLSGELSLPLVGTIEFANISLGSCEYVFLEAHGKGILELEVSLLDLNGPYIHCAVDLLKFCPSLKTLRLVGIIRSRTGYTLGFPDFLCETNGCPTLEKIEIVAQSCYNRKIQIWNLEAFFIGILEKLNEGLFPKLREIQTTEYSWPISHHHIEKDRLIKSGQHLKTTFGIDLTDSSGKPFRQRVKAPPLTQLHQDDE